jgi:hypothetical protein
MKENKPIISIQDITFIKKIITYYLNNGPFLTEKRKAELLNLFHRLGRLK